jgi:DNA-directed RNA polymerase subunit beta
MKGVFGEDKYLLATLDKDISKTEEEALIELYRRLRPGEPPTVDSAKTLINNLFFDPRRYDLSNVGRYKFNKKLSLSGRAAGKTLAAPVADPHTWRNFWPTRGQILSAA